MKLNMKYDGSMMATELSRLLGVAPMFTVAAAVLMLIITVFSVRDFVSTREQEQKSLELPQFSISSQPVGRKLYQDYAAVLSRLSPVVEVTVVNDALQVRIENAQHYPEFMFVMNSIQGVSDKVIWRAQEICLAGCQGAAAYATVKGLTEKVDVKLRGMNDE
ncbi:MAG TPA: hypothetical protein VFV39_06615 [Limnobacter sp.]|nr:hypothetical protein [Limnobacter sp.]